MKKLMISACAVALAASVHAAAALGWTSWGYLNNGEADSDWISGGQAYLINVTDAAIFAVADDLTITGGSIVDSAVLQEGSVYGSWLGAETALTPNQEYQFAILFTDQGKGDEGEGIKVPTSGFYGVDTDGDNGTGFYTVTWDAKGASIIADDGFAGASMSTAVAPEPTSGLLLLLGVAGLALRRRRA